MYDFNVVYRRLFLTWKDSLFDISDPKWSPIYFHCSLQLDFKKCSKHLKDTKTIPSLLAQNYHQWQWYFLLLLLLIFLTACIQWYTNLLAIMVCHLQVVIGYINQRLEQEKFYRYIIGRHVEGKLVFLGERNVNIIIS